MSEKAVSMYIPPLVVKKTDLRGWKGGGGGAMSCNTLKKENWRLKKFGYFKGHTIGRP